MNKSATALVAVLSCAVPAALAQPGSYLGPGVLSRGAGDIGNRGGEQVDLRFFGDVSGVYDSGLQPYAVDAKGNLISVSALYGVEANVGAYGTHRWRKALLGLDYSGVFTHYPSASTYDRTDQHLGLGYTYQKSRRLAFDFRQLAGIAKTGYGTAGFYGAPTDDFVTTPTALLFDNRYYYTQSTMDVNFIQSVRTIYTMGGDGFFVRRQGVGLASTNGYQLRGSVQHRLDRRRTVGAVYEHVHFDFPPAFGESDINVGELFFSSQLGRRWILNVSAGALVAEVQGIEQVALSPIIAALLGQSFTERAFYRQSVYPTGRAGLTARFKSSSLSMGYSQEITPGNGVYLTSLQKNGSLSYSYTGIRNWSFGLTGGYASLNGIGQGLQNYATVNGGFNTSYRVRGWLHATARFDARDQQIDVVGYKHTGYRAAIGLTFSPGDVPFSLW